jgi:hypothetical protein
VCGLCSCKFVACVAQTVIFFFPSRRADLSGKVFPFYFSRLEIEDDKQKRASNIGNDWATATWSILLGPKRGEKKDVPHLEFRDLFNLMPSWK